MDLKERLEEIAKRYGLADIYVFGSRAREIQERVEGKKRTSPTESPLSDVDIGVRPRFGVHLSAKERVELMVAFEDLFDAPRVDLIVLPEADPFLALDIIRGELLFTDDPDDQARYELFILRRAGDLMPFKKERIRMIFEEGGR